ncbi:MAG TPA: hypothetical protein VN748_09970 [Pseudonocardiaceae bacterium]|jgi:hypothetical protein|nr:hypothetical protein [Pseudonocardiaceae bacterium]
MSDVLSFAEIDVTHVELLPARTVLSMFRVSVAGDAGNGGQGGKGGVGGEGEGKAYFLYPYFYTEGDVTNSLTGGLGGESTADGGATTGGAATVAPAPAPAPAPAS